MALEINAHLEGLLHGRTDEVQKGPLQLDRAHEQVAAKRKRAESQNGLLQHAPWYGRLAVLLN